MTRKFKGIAYEERASELSTIYASDGTNFYIRNTPYTTKEGVQQAMNGENIYYVLANPTYTLIENEELLNQLDRIMQLYEGQNNILVTGDLAATLDLDYIVKAENHL